MMRALLCALALLSASDSAWAQTERAAAVVRHGVPVQEITSASGLTAWLVSDSTVPIVVVRAYWRGGSAGEPANLAGITGVMTDILTEGAGARDANAFKERMEELNMSLGFSAGWDGVGMTLTTLSENRDAAVALARDALLAPRFDAAPLERIRQQTLIGLRTRETNPSYIANLALDQTLYPDHVYARRTSPESVMAYSTAALARRKAELLRRDGLQVTIVGDITADDARVMLDALFAQLPQGAPPTEPADALLQAPTPLIVRPLPQPQALILFAAPGIQDEDPDWIALAVANYILGGGGFSSRLMDEVREQRGLVYGVSTGPLVRDHLSLVRGSAQTENGDVAQAISVMRDVMRRYHEEGASQSEVNDAITYMTGSFALDLDADAKIASVVHGYQIAGRDIAYINERNDLIRAVSLADVNRVIRRLLDPEKFTFVVVGQPEGLEAGAE